jgi:hypothetical protein
LLLAEDFLGLSDFQETNDFPSQNNIHPLDDDPPLGFSTTFADHVFRSLKLNKTD